MSPSRIVAIVWLLGWVGAVNADTWHVPKDHRTIQAAIDAAKPGDTVLVDAGTYRESVRLKERILVRSAGDDTPGTMGLKRAEATIIEGSAMAQGPAVILADAAVFDGFTVTKVGRFDQKEYDKHYAERGENLPDDRGAVGAAGSFPAVSIPAVTAIVRNNIVCNNGHAGIGCTSRQGQRNASFISMNVCYRNMGGGIGIADGAAPVVERNRCYSNLRGGIGNRRSRGLIVENECFDNVRAGIGVREGACPTIRGNKCHKNRRAGIGCRMEGTSPVIEGNDCYQNGMAGIGCRDGASPIIRKNQCHDNDWAGIGARDGARPVIVENKCYRNKEAGIGIESSARAVIAKNECHENEKAGIGQRGDAETVVEGNHLHHNKAAGIGFEACRSGKSTVLNNKIVDNGAVAAGIHGGWKVRLAGNTMSRPSGLPPIVQVFKDAEADISDNLISGSGVAGVRAEGIVRITGNRFDCPSPRQGGGPPQFAIWGLPGAELVVADNTIAGWRHALVIDKAAVTITGNRVLGFWQVGMQLTQPASPAIVTGNVFQSNADYPMIRVTGGETMMENNRRERPAVVK
jgi:parallel beta-helix repeat protein